MACNYPTKVILSEYKDYRRVEISENRSIYNRRENDVIVKYFNRSHKLSFISMPKSELIPFECYYYLMFNKEPGLFPRLLDHFLDGEQFGIVLEYLKDDWMDLDHLCAEFSMEEPLLMCIVSNILHSLGRIMAKNVYYLDLKPDNVMVNSSTLEVRIIDLEHMEYKREDNPISTKYVGTRQYMSPEIVLHKPFRMRKTMSFSMGCLLYNCIENEFPFSNVTDTILKEVQFKKSSPQLSDLISQCLDKNENTRLDITEIHNHLWFKS